MDNVAFLITNEYHMKVGSFFASTAGVLFLLFAWVGEFATANDCWKAIQWSSTEYFNADIDVFYPLREFRKKGRNPDITIEPNRISFRTNLRPRAIDRWNDVSWRFYGLVEMLIENRSVAQFRIDNGSHPPETNPFFRFQVYVDPEYRGKGIGMYMYLLASWFGYQRTGLVGESADTCDEPQAIATWRALVRRKYARRGGLIRENGAWRFTQRGLKGQAYKPVVDFYRNRTNDAPPPRDPEADLYFARD